MIPKVSLHTTVAKSISQKRETEKHILKLFWCNSFFKKSGETTQHWPWFIPLPLCSSFPKAHCFAMHFLKSPTCVLHMLLHGATETGLSHSSPFRGCVSIKQASSCAAMACGCLMTRLVVRYTTTFQGWMTAISTKLVVRHLCVSFFCCCFFFLSQQASVSDEWLRMALTSHCFGLTCTVCIVMQVNPLSFTQNRYYCRALRTTWMFLLFFFSFHGFTHAYTHKHAPTVLIRKDRYINCDLTDSWVVGAVSSKHTGLLHDFFFI